MLLQIVVGLSFIISTVCAVIGLLARAESTRMGFKWDLGDGRILKICIVASALGFAALFTYVLRN